MATVGEALSALGITEWVLRGEPTTEEEFNEMFKKITGKEVKIFFVNPTRKRSSARPIYDELFQEDFKLDTTVYNEFINWLN